MKKLSLCQKKISFEVLKFEKYQCFENVRNTVSDNLAPPPSLETCFSGLVWSASSLDRTSPQKKRGYVPVSVTGFSSVDWDNCQRAKFRLGSISAVLSGEERELIS